MSNRIFVVDESDDIDKSFKPTVEWMREKYDEMNKKLFNGELGECDFELFTTGKGSCGGVFGWFCHNNRNVKVEKNTRKLFVYSGRYDKIYLTPDNFAELCNPMIKLNGNLVGTEHAFLATLVHEMCHYYTYMQGYCPRQAHGKEFRSIGELVSHRSNGEFAISTYASADEVKEYGLGDELRAKKQAIAEKVKEFSVFVWLNDGTIELRLLKPTNNAGLLKIKKTCEEDDNCRKMLVVKNRKVSDYLERGGYDTEYMSARQVHNQVWELKEDKYGFFYLKHLWKLVFSGNFEWWVDKEPETTISEDSNDSDDDSIEIPNGMNLSRESPLEQEMTESINENRKITMTLGQLRRLIRETRI